MKQQFAFALGLSLIVSWCSSMRAAEEASDAAEEKPAPIVAVEPPEDDPDYPLLGEFLGPIAVGENRYEPLGLQVRPIGEDDFEALMCPGGLPGAESFSGETTKLVGHRSEDLLILSGGPWAIFVERDQCLVVDRRGQRLGQLERVRRSSPTLGAAPPDGAIVLFDGGSTEQFTAAKMTDDGLLMPGADAKPMFQDFDMHVEFRTPYMPASSGQGRGNSGCYLQSRYEVQVLDSFAMEPTFDGCGSFYRQRAPDLNMCLPPLEWQTYDIRFTAPRWSADGAKVRNAHIVLWHNGVKTQDCELESQTGSGKKEEPTLLPTRFQNHKDPVRFRNIWVIDRGLVDPPAFPPPPTSTAERAPAPR